MLYFWIQVFVKSVEDTFSSIGRDPKDIGATIVLFVVSSVVVYIRNGREAGWTKMTSRIGKMVKEDGVILFLLLLIVFFYHFYKEPYSMWNVVRAQADQCSTCTVQNGILKNEKDFWKHQSDSKDEAIRSRDGLLEKNFGVLSETQSSLAALSNKILDVTRPETLKITPFYLGVVENRKNPKVSAYSNDYILLTNKIITPVRLVVTCEPGLVQAGGGVLGTAAAMGGGWNIVPTPKTYGIGFSSPAWTPQSPMLVTIYSNTKDVACSFAEQ